MADPTLAPVPPAPTTGGPQGMPIPGAPMQIMLPQPLQEVMQQFPEVLKRLKAIEDKPAVAISGPPTKLVAAFAFLAGCSGMAFLVWLWFYAAVIFRL